MTVINQLRWLSPEFNASYSAPARNLPKCTNQEMVLKIPGFKNIADHAEKSRAWQVLGMRTHESVVRI